MNPIDLIRTTHEIDHELGTISAAVTDESLKQDLVQFHARWRELSYRVTASLCGLTSNGEAPVPRRRGRPRRSDVREETTAAREREEGASS
jgi:hypothetical protein